MTRHIVVVDTETTGLDPDRAVPVEVAWHDMTTGERGGFIPQHVIDDDADPKALEINGYWTRIDGRAQSGRDDVEYLYRLLTGNTLAGSNPSCDAPMLVKLFRQHGLGGGPVDGLNEGQDPGVRPWHHRMLDLAAYAKGRLCLTELPGLALVCEILEVAPPDHSAAGDVRATVECLRKLDEPTGELAGSEHNRKRTESALAEERTYCDDLRRRLLGLDLEYAATQRAIQRSLREVVRVEPATPDRELRLVMADRGEGYETALTPAELVEEVVAEQSALAQRKATGA